MNDNNTETKFILNSLEQIISLSNEELAKSILEIESNIDTSKNYDLLRRIHKSVIQYIEKKRDLVYIGFMGHFSSGKSSTINSILSLSGQNARDVDLHPSDKGISLITHPINEPSFIKLVNYGNIPVKPIMVEHDFLKNIVLIDTPGAGDTDPIFVNELMQGYLPICDIILYFVSSTNPLDKNDLPLLKAKHDNLSMIPTKFVITRADEFRKDFDKVLSEENFNPTEAEKFIVKAKARIEESIDLFKVDLDDFFIIDNKKRFNITSLLQFINDFTTSDNLQNKIEMHDYKIALFRKTGLKIKDNFSEHALKKLKTLNKYVTDANNNISRYDDKVRITNNRLTETWKNYQLDIERIKNKNIKDLEETYSLQLAVSIWDTYSLKKLMKDIHENFRLFKTSSISEYSKTFISGIVDDLKGELENLTSEIDSVRIGKFNGIDSHFNDYQVKNVPSLNINFSSFVERDLKKIQSELMSITKDLIFSMRSGNKSLSYRLTNFQPLGQLNEIIQDAEKQLYTDIDTHFEHVYLYRAGVFSEHVKEYITKLGIGNKLNQLEKEFNETFKESIKNNAKAIIFPDFEETKKTYEKTLRSFKQEFEEYNLDFSSIDISTVSFEKIDIHSKVEEDSAELKENLIQEINQRIKRTLKETISEIEENIYEIQKQFRENTKKLRKRRIIRLVSFLIVPALIFFPYSYFNFLELIPNVANSFLIGIAANILIPIISFIVGYYTDNYPEKIDKKKTDFKSDAIKSSKEILNNKLQLLRDGTYEYQVIEKQFRISLENQISDIKKQKFTEYIEQIYSKLYAIHKKDTELRKKYIEQITSLSTRINQYFLYDENKLEKISSDIKKEAIEPSFKFLENLKKDISKVYENLDEIKFVQ